MGEVFYSSSNWIGFTINTELDLLISFYNILLIF